jgi:very-short-patch-repair endonuclease
VTVDWDDSHRLDFYYEAHNLIIEVDGRKWHASRERFNGDRRRDNAASLEGKRVIRFTWTDVMRDEPYVVRTVKQALEFGSSSSHSDRFDHSKENECRKPALNLQ